MSIKNENANWRERAELLAMRMQFALPRAESHSGKGAKFEGNGVLIGWGRGAVGSLCVTGTANQLFADIFISDRCLTAITAPPPAFPPPLVRPRRHPISSYGAVDFQPGSGIASSTNTYTVFVSPPSMSINEP
jgi:hypothetical protein